MTIFVIHAESKSIKETPFSEETIARLAGIQPKAIYFFAELVAVDV